MTCFFCKERPSELPNSSCRECGMDDELDHLIFSAMGRSRKLGISDERFMEHVEAVVDVFDMNPFHRSSGAVPETGQLKTSETSSPPRH